MKMILGLASITSGEVDVFGENIKGRENEYIHVSVQLSKPQAFIPI